MRIVRVSEQEQSPARRKVYELAEMLDQFCIISCSRTGSSEVIISSSVVILDRYHLAINKKKLIGAVLAHKHEIKILIIVDENPSRDIWLPDVLEVHHHVVFCHGPTVRAIEASALYTASAMAAFKVIEFNSDIAA